MILFHIQYIVPPSVYTLRNTESHAC